MKGIQIALLVQSYGNFAEWVDFAHWLSFSGEGSVSAACAAGLFYMPSNLICPYNSQKSSKEQNFVPVKTALIYTYRT